MIVFLLWHTAERRQMKKKLEELNLLDDFLFGTLISHPVYGERFAKTLVATLLDRDVKILKIVPQMNFYGQDTDRHGARLDVYIEENSEGGDGALSVGSIFDIEPDRTEHTKEKKFLPRRVRFYCSTIDTRNLQSGSDYSQLKNVIIIMLLPYDPFGYNRIIYTVKNKCLEEPEMAYDDGVLNLFLFTGGKVGTVPQPLKELLRYIENITWQNAVNDSLKEIQTMVDKVKHKETAIVVYMRGLIRDQLIKNEGRQEGLQEGLKECLFSILSDLGSIPENVLAQINDEDDTDILNQWIKLAARSDSMEEFTQKISS